MSTSYSSRTLTRHGHYRNHHHGTSSSSSSSNNSVNSTDLLKASVFKFFQDDRAYIERFLPIINRTSNVSLRILDYFCVNYSRAHQVNYMVKDTYFEAHSSYKTQLKSLSKKSFDPFRRNARLTINYNNERFDTTVGQLSFFRWCILNNVLDYVEQNLVAISEHMKQNCNKGPTVPEYPPVVTEKKRRTSRRKSALNIVATRVMAPPGQTSILVSFE